MRQFRAIAYVNNRYSSFISFHLIFKVTKVQTFNSGLIIFVLSSHLRIFHLHGDVTIAGEGLGILTYVRHSWSLSSEDSLACHIYCDTGHRFIMPRTLELTPFAERLAVELLLRTSFYDFGLSRLGLNKNIL